MLDSLDMTLETTCVDLSTRSGSNRGSRAEAEAAAEIEGPSYKGADCKKESIVACPRGT